MIRVICDKCGVDCDATAYAIAVEVIHNPTPRFPTDTGDIKITDDKNSMRMCLCQNCYKELGFPNIYEVVQTKKLNWDCVDRQPSKPFPGVRCLGCRYARGLTYKERIIFQSDCLVCTSPHGAGVPHPEYVTDGRIVFKGDYCSYGDPKQDLGETDAE